MNHKLISFIFIFMVIALVACNEHKTNEIIENVSSTDNVEIEKKAILKTLNDETKSAFNRDYQGWRENWVHEKYASKTYMNFADNTMTETLGWEEISNFVKTYIEEHPEPEPIPRLLDNIEVRLYENGAWVNFVQEDAERGLKRETRLMEKVNGKWKIAGMQTIIYGFKNKD